MANSVSTSFRQGVDPASLSAAVQAVESAIPFVEWLMQRFHKIAHDLRSGEDKDALDRISSVSKDLEDFFQYTYLISDMCTESPDPQSLYQNLSAYQARLSKVLESINPALDTLDLVEVADIVEHELLETLAEYAPVHDQISQSLAA